MYSRCLVANGADPVGAASGTGSFWHIVFTTGFADALSARLA